MYKINAHNLSDGSAFILFCLIIQYVTSTEPNESIYV